MLVALRSFHDDDVLSGSPLGASPEEVRSAVWKQVEATFTSVGDDPLLRVLLEQTYLDPAGGHQAAMRDQHMSRSSYYRHLQRARARFAEVTPGTAS